MLAWSAAAAETCSAAERGADPSQPQDLASDERRSGEICDRPGEYAQRFDGVGDSGAVDGLTHTLVIGDHVPGQARSR